MVFPYQLLLPELALLALFAGQLLALAFRGRQSFIAWATAVALVEVIFLGTTRPAFPTADTLLFIPITDGNQAASMVMVADLSALFSLIWLAVSRMPAAGFLSFFITSALFGVHLIGFSADAVLSFIGLEVISLSSFAAVAWPNRRESLQAALRFAFIGVFASAVMVYGLSFLYGARGETSLLTNLPNLGENASIHPFALYLVVILCLAGALFKIGAIPFHAWMPDVYAQAPLPVTAFLSVAPKVAGLMLALRLLEGGLPEPEGATVFAVFAVLSMVAGNLAGLFQRNFFSLMAFSSIAHSGFAMLAAFALPGQTVPFYLTTLLVGNYCMFLFWQLLPPNQGRLTDIAGLGRRYPILIFTAVTLALSLAGLPPTIGFLAKFRLVLGLFDTTSQNPLSSLAVAVVVNSAISIAYYLKIAYQLAFSPEGSLPSPALSSAKQVQIGLLGALVLLLFFFPQLIQAVASLSGSHTKALLQW